MIYLIKIVVIVDTVEVAFNLRTKLNSTSNLSAVNRQNWSVSGSVKAVKISQIIDYICIINCFCVHQPFAKIRLYFVNQKEFLSRICAYLVPNPELFLTKKGWLSDSISSWILILYSKFNISNCNRSKFNFFWSYLGFWKEFLLQNFTDLILFVFIWRFEGSIQEIPFILENSFFTYPWFYTYSAS